MAPSSTEAGTRAFITALFGDDDRLAILAVGRTAETAESVFQRIRPASLASGERFQRWLRHLNATGHDIFVSMNPIRPESRGREKSDVAEVRRLQLDLDEKGPESLRRVMIDVSSGRLPAPLAVVRSSPGHYQVLWNTSPGWSTPTAEDTMGRLADHYEGDPAVVDVARCMRLPGFRNKKVGREDALVRWTGYPGPRVKQQEFDHLPPRQQLPRDPTQRRTTTRTTKATPSDHDWAFVREALKRGQDPTALTRILEQQRQDKPNPRYYAERTVRRARESLAREKGPSNRLPAQDRGRGRQPLQHSSPPAAGNARPDAGERQIRTQFRPDWSGPGR